MSDSSVDKVMARYQELSAMRSNYESVWDEVTEFILPSKGSYSYRDSRSDPERRSRRRFDSTAINAARSLTARVLAEMTGTGLRWFDFRDPDPDIDKLPNVRRFLQDLSDDVYSIINNSSFRMAHVEATADWVAYGTACVLKEEIDGEINHRSIPVQELYIGENVKGEVDLVIRKYKLSLRQLIEHFGEENLPENLLAKKELRLDEEHEVLHAVMPNDEYYEGKKNKKYFKFKSCHVLPEFAHELREGGFKRMPYYVFRFWKRSNEVYGGSPGVDALADIRMLNLMVEADGRSIQLEAFPPMIMAHDSVVAPMRIIPNGINYGGMSPDGRRLVDRLIPAGNAGRGGLEHVMEQKRQAIRSSFFVDPLINRENSIRTAAEVVKRSNEEMVGITPFLSRYEVEYLTPVLDDLLDYVLRKDENKENEIPAELEGRIPKIEYTGTLAKTQRAQELNNTVQFLQIVQGLAQVDPAILQNIDMQAAFNRFADLLSVPQDIITSEEEMAQKQQQQQQMMQQAQGVQGMQQVTDSMANLAKSGLLKRSDLGLPDEA